MKPKIHNPATDIKNLTFDQLVSEWEKTEKAKRTSAVNSDHSKETPFFANTNIDIRMSMQYKMWAIEKEIKSEYSHLIDELEEEHNDLWVCLTIN